MAFRVIAAEAIAQNLRPDEVLTYASKRLGELGKEIEKISGTANPTTNTSKPTASNVNVTAASTTNIVILGLFVVKDLEKVKLNDDKHFKNLRL